MEDIEDIPYTCKYIDEVVDIVKAHIDDKYTRLDAEANLEEIRALNHRLREHGYAMVDLLREKQSEIDVLEDDLNAAKNNLEDAEYEISQLRREIEAMERAY